MELSTKKPTSRETKYCNAIRAIVKRRGHATNAEVLQDVRQLLPNTSATTIHRATARLAARGELRIAPPDNQGAMRYDSNLEAHDHFMCAYCGKLRDLTIASDVIPIIESRLENCEITGNITISGACQACRSRGNDC